MSDENPDTSALLAKAQTAHRLAVSERTVDRLAADGRLTRVFVTGGLFRFRRSDVDALVASGARRATENG